MKRRRRQPIEQWRETRERVWQRDRGKCQGPYCLAQPDYSLPLRVAHIDHIEALSRGGRNGDENLRVLCRRCHVLRSSISHQGMIANALRDGIIPADWRSWVWDG